jgi:hypothetical protein
MIRCRPGVTRLIQGSIFEALHQANFHGRDPNHELAEINLRNSGLYPREPGRNHITVRGFQMSQAATQWAAPTAEQTGLTATANGRSGLQ